ncbi:CLUMA_CG014535, isoform A [Clunio marinus]|uniref:CLUMA_CG014535, isoform A n=1 Tax=Clunio marinus TaxID=568069 RepID=A0A1J1IRE8_9DIPT|nr:CLUMA_CG014535, isoform A [Clunio marinus]
MKRKHFSGERRTFPSSTVVERNYCQNNTNNIIFIPNVVFVPFNIDLRQFSAAFPMHNNLCMMSASRTYFKIGRNNNIYSTNKPLCTPISGNPLRNYFDYEARTCEGVSNKKKNWSKFIHEMTISEKLDYEVSMSISEKSRAFIFTFITKKLILIFTSTSTKAILQRKDKYQFEENGRKTPPMFFLALKTQSRTIHSLNKMYFVMNERLITPLGNSKDQDRFPFPVMTKDLSQREFPVMLFSTAVGMSGKAPFICSHSGIIDNILATEAPCQYHILKQRYLKR